MSNFKMKNYREKWDIIEEIERKNKATPIRNFPEYNYIEDNDIILSIEYWFFFFYLVQIVQIIKTL